LRVPGRLLALALAGCSATAAADAPMGPAEVGVVTLVAEPVTVSNELTGRTAATTASDVRPQVDGVIKARLFEEGSIVHAGQPLYQIDPRLYKASLDQARGQLENAQATLFTNQAKADRYKTLRDNQAVSRQDIDDTIAAARPRGRACTSIRPRSNRRA
jgi:membrane fusion protein (multidrug efflux system)